MEKKKRIIILSILSILIITFLVIGITYAFMKQNIDTSSVTEVSLTSCAKITLTDTGSINLSNTYPMTKNRALQTTPYTFTVTSSCETYVGFNLYLATLSTNTIAASNIHYIITNVGSKEIITEGILSSATNVTSSFTNEEKTQYNTGLNGTVNTIYQLYNDKIPLKGTSSYDLYLYIDESVTNDTMGKSFVGGIAVKSYDREADPSVVYWDDNFSDTNYTFPNTPATTYTSPTQLSNQYYIKTTATEHQACLYYNNNEFCLKANYWDTDGSTTQTKLQNEMASALGVDASELSCESNSTYAHCDVSDFACYADSDGYVGCSSVSSICGVYSDGNARCG